jgi:hypothetical protein
MAYTLHSIYQVLKETKHVLIEALKDLVERDRLLRNLERSSAELANRGQEFEAKARKLEARRRLTLGCVVAFFLVGCFLFLAIISYLTNI